MSPYSSDSESVLTVRVPRLTTPRLLLRPFKTADYPDYAAALDDPEANKFTPRRTDERSAWWSFAASSGGWILDGAGWWAVEARETGKVVGTVGVFIRETARDDFEIGWSLYRAFWRQGFASEAAAAALAFAFEGHHAKRVIAHIAPENTASIAVSEKIGMTYDTEVELWGKPIGRYVVSRA